MPRAQVVPEDFPQVSRGERDRRWAAIRREMSWKGIDCLLVVGSSARWNEMHGNIRYLTNYADPLSTMSYAIFPAHGDGTLIVQMTVKRSLLAQSWLSDVRPRATANVPEILAERVTALGMQRGTLGLVAMPYGEDERICIPYTIRDRIRETLPQLRLVDASDMFVALRSVKSEEEIGCLEKSAALCDLAFRKHLELIHPGMRERELAASLVEAVEAEGADPPTLVLLNSGPMPREELMGDPFFSGRILRGGDVVTSEIGPKWAGYQAQSMQCVSLGPPGRKLQELAKYGIEVFHKVVDRLRPGNSAGEAAGAGDDVIARAEEKLGAELARGLRPLIHESGFGGPDPTPRPWTIQANQAFMVEIGPGQTAPQHVYVGSCYIVTPSGPRLLGKVPPGKKILAVAGGSQ